MSLVELLDDCARRGIVLWTEGDKLQVRGPAGAVTQELQEALRRHKSELMVRLQSGAAPERAPRNGTTRPLSLVQQGLWFLHRLDPATLPAYNIRKAIELEGALERGVVGRLPEHGDSVAAHVVQ